MKKMGASRLTNSCPRHNLYSLMFYALQNKLIFLVIVLGFKWVFISVYFIFLSESLSVSIL